MPRSKESMTTQVRSSARPSDKYEYLLATVEEHGKVTTLKQLKSAGPWDVSMGLFCNGAAIGSGGFRHINWRKKYISTENVRLGRRFRRKGHGVALYTALINCAKSLGAKRLYSSSHLNKYSTRMWREKLSTYGFNVKTEGKECRRPCKHCGKYARYYIDL